MDHSVDLLTVSGARELAEKVSAYWHGAGATHVVCRVMESENERQTPGTIAVVRSNLVNGLPPKRRTA